MAATKHKTRAIKVSLYFIHILNGCEGSLCGASRVIKHSYYMAISASGQDESNRAL